MSKQKLDKVSTQVVGFNREPDMNLDTTNEWATIHRLDQSPPDHKWQKTIYKRGEYWKSRHIAEDQPNVRNDLGFLQCSFRNRVHPVSKSCKDSMLEFTVSSLDTLGLLNNLSPLRHNHHLDIEAPLYKIPQCLHHFTVAFHAVSFPFINLSQLLLVSFGNKEKSQR